MARGGKRKGAGRKTSWNTKETETAILRLPKLLANSLLMARDNQILIDDLIMAINELSNKNNESVTKSKKIELPTNKNEYILLVEELKKSPEWNKKNSHVQNTARILKALGIVLPNGLMSRTKFNEYIKGLT